MDKFIEARRAYQRLQSKYSAGKLDKLTFQQAAEELAVKDQFGDMWQIGVVSGNWYRFDGRQWVEDYPPPSDLGLPPSSPAVDDKTELKLAAVKELAPWHIIIESSTSAEQRIPIDQDLIIGRDRNINVHLDDPQASRRHAIIQKSGQDYLLTDQNSSNGTELNGRRIQQPARLKHGDRISIGDTQIRVEGDPVSAPDTVISHKPVEAVSAPTLPPTNSACPYCGKVIKSGRKFCGSCGTPIAPSAPPQTPAKSICSQCHQPVNPGAKFCRNCGTPWTSRSSNDQK